MSDTPETDAAALQDGTVVAARVARRLECERDLLRVQYRTTELLGVALVKTIDELKAELAGYRDEACRESCRDKEAADRAGGNPWGNR